jgi:hypothetical protein
LKANLSLSDDIVLNRSKIVRIFVDMINKNLNQERRDLKGFCKIIFKIKLKYLKRNHLYTTNF